MFCSKCGTKLEEGARFCSNCGTTVGAGQATQAQANSNAAYSAGVQGQFNNGAGTGQYQSPYNQSGSNQYGPAPGMQYAYNNGSTGMNKRNITIIAAAAAVVVIAVVLVILLSGGGKPSDTVKKFANAINNKDVSGMLSCVDSTAAQEFSMLVFMELVQSDAKVNISNIISENISGDDAAVIANTVATRTIDGTSETQTEVTTFSLKKIDGQWKIVDIQ